jgi:hypothetical protein
VILVAAGRFRAASVKALSAWNDDPTWESTRAGPCFRHIARETKMIGEGQPLRDFDGASRMQQAKEAVQAAADTVKVTTQTVADAIEAGRQPGAPLDRLAEWARAAPLRALAVAFVVGMVVARRR